MATTPSSWVYSSTLAMSTVECLRLGAYMPPVCDAYSIRTVTYAMMPSYMCMPAHAPDKERGDGFCRARGSGACPPAPAGPGDLSHPAAAIPVGCGRPGGSPRRAALCSPGGAARRRAGPHVDGRGTPHAPSPRPARGAGTPGPTDVYSCLSRGAHPDLP